MSPIAAPSGASPTFDLMALRRTGALSALDAQLARSLTGRHDGVVTLLIALASRHTRAGHVRLDLDAVAGRPIHGADGEPLTDQSVPALDELRHALGESPLVRRGDGRAPLVLEADRYLYLSRYFEHEHALATRLLRRAARSVVVADSTRARSDLQRVFGPPPAETDLQRVAACVASLRALCVISGGPGTGKTTTVVRVLAVILGQLLAAGHRRPRAALLAPTGKAARRLSEAVGAVARGLDLDEATRALIPAEASTIHRAIGRTTGTGTRRFAAEVVVVDEASMVDVALMRTLVDAVRDDARLILLGDADQLASVEAGAVLSDICRARKTLRLGASIAAEIEATFGEPLAPSLVAAPQDDDALSSCVVQLEKSHRFGEDTAIGQLASAVRRGDASAAIELLAAPGSSVAHHALAPPQQLGPALERSLVDGFTDVLTAASPERALARLGHYRILCARRRGPGGVEAANAFAEQRLAAAGLLQPSMPYYHGRQLLVTENDASIELFNGDIGLVWRRGSGNAVVLFPGPAGGIREVSPSRLPSHETAFAMSIHKSQGSELDRATILLPEPASPLLSRELLYTALTRARTAVTLFGTAAAVEACVTRRLERDSGLRELLRGSGGDRS